MFGPVSYAISLVLSVGTLVIKGWAFFDCLRRPRASFSAVNRLDKTFWTIVLGLGFGVGLLYAVVSRGVAGWGGFFGIIGITAALIYLFGIRPAIAPNRGGGKGRSSSDGPYGPW